MIKDNGKVQGIVTVEGQITLYKGRPQLPCTLYPMLHNLSCIPCRTSCPYYFCFTETSYCPYDTLSLTHIV